MRTIQKSFHKATHKIDAFALNTLQGIGQVSGKIKSVRNQDSIDYNAPPEISSVPSFVVRGCDVRVAEEPLKQQVPEQDADSRHATEVRDEGAYNDAHVASDNSREESASSSWWTALKDTHYLCISVREAKNLPIVDHDTRSTTSSVRISLGDELEGQTRSCHRNRNPMWAQSFSFPLTGLTPQTKLALSVFSNAAMGVLDHFSGQVLTTLGYFLEPASKPLLPFSRWYRLTRRRAGDRVSGEILLIVGVIPKTVHDVISWSEDGSNLLDPNILKVLISPYTLNINVTEVNLFRASRPMDLSTKLAIKIRVGRNVLIHKFDPKELRSMEEGSGGKHIMSFKVDQQISLSLSKAFEISYNWLTKKKDRDEVGEVKIYIMRGKEVLAKTQVPIWDVPVYKEDASSVLERTSSSVDKRSSVQYEAPTAAKNGTVVDNDLTSRPRTAGSGSKALSGSFSQEATDSRHTISVAVPADSSSLGDTAVTNEDYRATSNHRKMSYMCPLASCSSPQEAFHTWVKSFSSYAPPPSSVTMTRRGSTINAASFQPVAPPPLPAAIRCPISAYFNKRHSADGGTVSVSSSPSKQGIIPTSLTTPRTDKQAPPVPSSATAAAAAAAAPSALTTMISEEHFMPSSDEGFASVFSSNPEQQAKAFTTQMSLLDWQARHSPKSLLMAAGASEPSSQMSGFDEPSAASQQQVLASKPSTSSLGDVKAALHPLERLSGASTSGSSSVNSGTAVPPGSNILGVNNVGAPSGLPSSKEEETPDGALPLTGLAITRNFMRTKWGPELYRRPMEGYSDNVLGHPEIKFSLGLLPVMRQLIDETTVSGGGKQLTRGSLGSGPLYNHDGCEADVSVHSRELGGREYTEADAAALMPGGRGDVSSVSSQLNHESRDAAPTPIRPPLALPVELKSVLVGAPPQQVFEALFAAESRLRASDFKKQELREVVTGPWASAAIESTTSHLHPIAGINPPDSSSGQQEQVSKTRTVGYIKPLHIPLPMSPKQCYVKEVQTVLNQGPGGFVVETKVTNDAVKGDAYFVLIQTVGVAEGSRCTRVMTSFKVVVLKSLGFLKGAIEGGALSGTKKQLMSLMDDLVTELGGPPVLPPAHGAHAYARQQAPVDGGDKSAARDDLLDSVSPSGGRTGTTPFINTARSASSPSSAADALINQDGTDMGGKVVQPALLSKPVGLAVASAHDEVQGTYYSLSPTMLMLFCSILALLLLLFMATVFLGMGVWEAANSLRMIAESLAVKNAACNSIGIA